MNKQELKEAIDRTDWLENTDGFPLDVMVLAHLRILREAAYLTWHGMEARVTK